MFNNRAFLRRTALITGSIFVLVFGILILATNAVASTAGWFGVAMNGGILLALAIDWLVCRFYWSHAKILKPRTSLAHAFFIEGVTWRLLKLLAKRAMAWVQPLLMEGARFPDLDIPAVILREGAQAAAMLIDAAIKEQSAKALAEEERRRREARRLRERADVVARGVALGMPETEIIALAAQDIVQARDAVYRRECEHALIERASARDCADEIGWLISAGKMGEAEKLVVSYDVVLEKARTYGIEEEVRILIRNRDLAGARGLVARAEERRSFEEIRTSFEARIAALPPERRVIPKDLLAQLDIERLGTREFRKQVHQLKKVLERQDG